MKLDQSIEYNKKKFFFKNHAKNDAGRLVPNLSLFFEKAGNEIKASDLKLKKKWSTCLQLY